MQSLLAPDAQHLSSNEGQLEVLDRRHDTTRYAVMPFKTFIVPSASSPACRSSKACYMQIQQKRPDENGCICNIMKRILKHKAKAAHPVACAHPLSHVAG